MTNEEKQLLLKDLCARLPYGVLFMVYDDEINEPVELLSINSKSVKPLEIDDGYDENSSTYWNLEDVKPYLRPMSSMTKEEYREFRKDSTFEAREAYEVRADGENNIVILQADCDLSVKELDWLNAHHFDYRGLIEKGLALEAPADMYKTE